MAIEKNIKINVDTKGAVNEVNKLDDSFKKLDKETEKTSKGLKDVGENGGAIAILDSLTGGLATRVRDAYEATKLFNFSLKGTRTALIATGVGAFVVAVGLVVAYWDDIVDYIQGANENLETQNKLIQNNIDLLKLSLSRNELLEKSLIEQGKSTGEILRLRDKILQSLQLETLASIQNLRTERDKVVALARQVTLRERLSKEFTLSGGKKGGGLIDDDERLAIDELNKGILEAENALISLGLQREVLANQQKETTILTDPVREKENGFELENGLTFEDNLTLGSRELLNEKLLGLDEELRNNIEMRATMAENERIADDARERERKQLLADAIIQIAGQTAGLVGAIAKEGTALAKGAAVAQATISGFQGVQNAFSTAAASPVTTFFPAYPFIQAGLAGAFSAIQIAKIGKVSSNGGGQSPNGQTGGGGGRTPQAPAFNLVQGSASNQIANSLQRGNEPVKAYVTSRDMTSTQQLDRAIESGSTL